MSSYGEIAYRRPTKSPRDARVEQLYVEREFAPGVSGKAGLFLMPFGLLNQNHEPTAYHGVTRNYVDTAIIPTTWREVGLGLSGSTASGLGWDVGLTTGFNLTKWDPTSPEGREGPLRATHGEGQFAAARDLSVYGALNWRGVPGLLIGGAVFTGMVGHQTAGFEANDSTLLLLDVHAWYQFGGWDLSAQYANGAFGHTEALNRSFLANRIATPTLVPSRFYGGYVQAAYKLWRRQDYVLLPFARNERFNTAAGYGALSAAEGGSPTADEQVWSLGASLRIGEGVVLKADYQKFHLDRARDQLNLGMGYSF